MNYRLLQETATWKIYDVTVDAISIIANYRNQFNRVMNNQGYPPLISDLKRNRRPWRRASPTINNYGFLRRER